MPTHPFPAAHRQGGGAPATGGNSESAQKGVKEMRPYDRPTWQVILMPADLLMDSDDTNITPGDDLSDLYGS